MKRSAASKSYYLLLLGFFSVNILLLANCAPQQPGVEDLYARETILAAGTTYTHPQNISCTICHRMDRPLSVSASGSTHIQTNDCFYCHANNAGVTWQDAKYNHANKATDPPSLCVQCHTN